MLRLQSENRFNEIITVNGRYIVDGAVVQACREAQVECSLIESASATPGKYTIYEVSPHDIPSVQGMHLELWDKAASGKNEIAERGLQLKLSGRESPGFDFRSNFTEDFKRKLNSSSQKIAVFFPSTDREFAIFPEFVHQESFGGSQAEAFLAFSRIAKRYGYHVIVRVHPVNSKLPKKLQDKFVQIEDAIWYELCSTSGSEIIESRSRISSYDLIEKAQLCATYASSISIECILSGKPTLILGESEISYCVPEICAFNEAQLASKFNDGIPIMKKSDLYPYGYWLQSAGMELKLFNFISDHEVYFSNKLVNEYRSWAKIMLFIRSSIRI